MSGGTAVVPMEVPSVKPLQPLQTKSFLKVVKISKSIGQ